MAAAQDSVTLRSSDGEDFVVSKSVAVQSVTIRNLIEENCSGDVIPILEVDAVTLAKIVELMNKHAEKDLSDEDRQKLTHELLDGAPVENLFVLVMAANYLEVKELYDGICQKIADMMKNKSVEWVRKVFRIENDFTQEEEEQLMSEHRWAYAGVDPDE